MNRIVKVMVLCAIFAAGTASVLGAGGNELAAAALRGDEGTVAMELSRGGSLPWLIQMDALSPAVLRVVLAFNEESPAEEALEDASTVYIARETPERFASPGAVAWQVAHLAEPAAPFVSQELAEARFGDAVLAAALCGDCQKIAALLASGAGGRTSISGLTAAAEVALASGHPEAAALLAAFSAGRRAALN